MKVFSVAEMMSAEKTADASGIISYSAMMEQAGQAIANAIIQRHTVKGLSILVLVGTGNNGGDGLVAAYHLAEAGADVACYLYKARDPNQDDNFRRVQEAGIFVVTAEFDQRYRVLRNRLHTTELIIDGLLGTGVSRPITGNLAKLFKQVRAGIDEWQDSFAHVAQTGLTAVYQTQPPRHPHHLHVVAIDCPSGLHCDTGAVDPLTIPADLTITFAGAKRGHLLFPGAGICGELLIADIGIPSHITDVVKVEMLTAVELSTHLPPRPLDGHKGTFGKLLICAGSADYWGAPFLAGLGAYRAGAGLVALAVPSTIRPTIAGQLPEATFPSIPAKEHLEQTSAEMLHPTLTTYNALLVGPGMGTQSPFLAQLLTYQELPPLILDADALNLLALQKKWWTHLPPYSILTPHPGEMARLMGISLSTLKQENRLDVAQAQAQKWKQIVVLKGAHTVIAHPDGCTHVLPFAHPALSVAGSGDVLAGVIASMVGQGLDPFMAAVVGGWIHGATAINQPFHAGVLAHQIADIVPHVLHQLRS